MVLSSERIITSEWADAHGCYAARTGWFACIGGCGRFLPSNGQRCIDCCAVSAEAGRLPRLGAKKKASKR